MEVLDTLTEREEKVLRLRFGLDDGRARTLEELVRNLMLPENVSARLKQRLCVSCAIPAEAKS